MHLCLVIGDQYPPQNHGGVGTYAADLCRYFIDHGHQATCICRNGTSSNGTGVESGYIDGVHVLRLSKPLDNFPKRLNSILYRFRIANLVRRVHKEKNIDILEYEDGGGLLSFGKLPNVTKIVRLHATTIYNDYELKRPPSRLMHFFERKALSRANFIVSATDYVARTTLSLLELKREYIRIPLGIDVDLFSPKGDNKIMTGDILFTGAMANRKGVYELIVAMKTVIEAHPEAQLYLASPLPQKNQKNEYYDEVLKQISPETKAHIRFLGMIPRKELPGLIQRADVCCFPSKSETFGLGIIEAMAMGKAVIYMKKQPGPEIIEDGISGLLCDTFSPVEIAASINRLLDNPGLAKELGKNARLRAITLFDKNICLSTQLNYYLSIIDARKN